MRSIRSRAARKRRSSVISALGAFVLLPVRAYRLFISPMLGANCRYMPTCSAYAEEAVKLHGPWAGGWMMTARLCRCHPLGPAGFDAVPEKLPVNGRWYMPWRYGRWTGRHMVHRFDERSRRS